MAPRGDNIKQDSIECAGITIAYSWCHSRRRTLGITVRPDMSVSVRVPLRTTIKDVRAFVTSRAEWALKVWKKMNGQSPPQQQGYERGAVFMYLGEAYRLEFTKGMRSTLQLNRDQLHRQNGCEFLSKTPHRAANNSFMSRFLVNFFVT